MINKLKFYFTCIVFCSYFNMFSFTIMVPLLSSSNVNQYNISLQVSDSLENTAFVFMCNQNGLLIKQDFSLKSIIAILVDSKNKILKNVILLLLTYEISQFKKNIIIDNNKNRWFLRLRNNKLSFEKYITLLMCEYTVNIKLKTLIKEFYMIKNSDLCDITSYKKLLYLYQKIIKNFM